MAHASVEEVTAAQAFLRYLGADWHNNYLIIAVVSWVRQESGSLRNVIGNNPFNIRPNSTDANLRSGVRKSHKYGGFSIYPTLSAGLQAAAALLKSGGNDYRGYGLVIAAAMRGDAVDFLRALALSRWDAGNYGGADTTDPAYNDAHNALLRIYSTFTGLTLPGKPGPQPKPPKQKPHKTPIKPLTVVKPPPAKLAYMNGFSSEKFYRARHSPSDTYVVE